MDSMEEIYQQYAQVIYKFLMSKTQDSDLAEELTQETFFQAVRSINRFEEKSSILTWLCSIAKNLLLQHYRESKKIGMLENIENLQEHSEISIEEVVLQKWESIEVLKILHNQKEPMREVMYLRLIGNLTFRQIGEIMGKNENWARITYYRGKEKIMKEAEEL